jgi:hypothetical protein
MDSNLVEQILKRKPKSIMHGGVSNLAFGHIITMVKMKFKKMVINMKLLGVWRHGKFFKIVKFKTQKVMVKTKMQVPKLFVFNHIKLR